MTLLWTLRDRKQNLVFFHALLWIGRVWTLHVSLLSFGTLFEPMFNIGIFLHLYLFICWNIGAALQGRLHTTSHRAGWTCDWSWRMTGLASAQIEEWILHLHARLMLFVISVTIELYHVIHFVFLRCISWGLDIQIGFLLHQGVRWLMVQNVVL